MNHQIRILMLKVGAVLASTVFLACPPTVLFAADGQREVVAVFNFAQRDDDPKYAWLSKGLADLLINQLADLPRITVVSRDRMQQLLSEYESVSRDPAAPPQPSPEQFGQNLQAKRVVFGTCAVQDDQATLTCQVTDVKTEQVAWQSQVRGPYAEVLNLERELARRLRAYFLGRAETAVPITDVPRWTTSVGASEHLYAGLDLFDRGEFAEAWLRFRLAARADPSYPDAAYWQARMFYYLTLYENAQPAYRAFLEHSPHHPRAGDAALELIDSARQVLDDPRQIEAVYEDVKSRIDPRTLVYNRNSRGVMRLNWYIEKLIINARLGCGDYDGAADRAIALQEEIDRSGVNMYPAVHENMIFDGYSSLARYTALDRFRATDRLVLRPGMFLDKEYRFSETKLKDQTVDSDMLWGPGPYLAVVVHTARGYQVNWAGGGNAQLVAPEGYRFDHIRLTAKPHHEQNSPAVAMYLHLNQGVYGDTFVAMARTDEGEKTFAIPPIHRCRFLMFEASLLGADADTYYPRPVHDGYESYSVTVDLAPLEPDRARIDVHCTNGDRVRIALDGQYALVGDGLIRGVSPGRHTVSLLPIAALTDSKRTPWKEASYQVEVPEEGTVRLEAALEFDPARNPLGVTSGGPFGGSYPMGRLAPRSDSAEMAAPCVVKATRGPLAGYLVTVWGYHEQLWLSTSNDNGRNWSPVRQLPVPVNTAHVQRVPQLVQGEDGRFCLAFLSDRNVRRVFNAYLTTSEDLEHWSAPAQLAEMYADDVRLFQDQAGRYRVILPPVNKGDQGEWTYSAPRGSNVAEARKVDWSRLSATKYGRSRTVLLTSSNLKDWVSSEPDWQSDQIARAQILQTADGRYQAFYIEKTVDQANLEEFWLYHRSSDDGVHWSDKERILRQHYGRLYNLSVVTDGRYFYGCAHTGMDFILYFELDRDGRVYRHEYSGLLSTRSAMCWDPLEKVVHWVAETQDGFRSEYQPLPGVLFSFQFDPARQCLRSAAPVNGINPHEWSTTKFKYLRELGTP